VLALLGSSTTAEAPCSSAGTAITAPRAQPWARPCSRIRNLVARDAKVAWQTTLWYWMTQNGAASRTCHASMADGYGLGKTIRSINGPLECDGGDPGTVQSRIDAYRRFCQLLGVDPGSNLGC